MMGKQMCPECDKKDREEFAAVKAYLRDNPTADIVAVSEATGVSVKRIQEYLREGRLVLAQRVEWLRCEVCGAPIQSGWLCAKCAGEIGRPAPRPQVNEPAPEPEPPEIGRYRGRGKVIRDKWRRWE